MKQGEKRKFENEERNLKKERFQKNSFGWKMRLSYILPSLNLPSHILPSHILPSHILLLGKLELGKKLPRQNVT